MSLSFKLLFQIKIYDLFRNRQRSTPVLQSRLRPWLWFENVRSIYTWFNRLLYDSVSSDKNTKHTLPLFDFWVSTFLIACDWYVPSSNFFLICGKYCAKCPFTAPHSFNTKYSFAFLDFIYYFSKLEDYNAFLSFHPRSTGILIYLFCSTTYISISCRLKSYSIRHKSIISNLLFCIEYCFPRYIFSAMTPHHSLLLR